MTGPARVVAGLARATGWAALAVGTLSLVALLAPAETRPPLRLERSLTLVLLGGAVALGASGGRWTLAVARANAAAAMGVGLGAVAVYATGWLPTRAPLPLVLVGRGLAASLVLALALLLTTWGVLALAQKLAGVGVWLAAVEGVAMLEGVGPLPPAQWGLGASLQLMLGLGVLLLRPDGGVLRNVFHTGPGGVMARRFVPGVLLGALGFTWLGLLADRSAHLTAQAGEWLVGLSAAALAVALITERAARLNADEAERRRAAATLASSETRYRLLAEHATDMISQHSPEGRYLFVSPACRTLLGYEPDELVGRLAYDFFHPEDLDAIRRSHRVILEGTEGYTVEYRIRRKDGGWVWFETTSRTVRDPDSGAVREIVAVSRDASARKQAERELRASEARYRRIVETTLEGIWTLDPEGRLTYANRRLAAILGYREDELIGRPIDDFVDPEARSLLAQKRERRRQGLAEQYEMRFFHRDGDAVDALITASPIYDEDGAYAGSLGMLTDLTEHRRLEEEYRHAQKLEAVGRLAAGIAHDFNNTLGVVIGRTELALARMPPAPEAAALRQIRSAAMRGGALTRQLLAFSRKQVLQPRRVDLNAVLADAEALIRPLVGEDVDLRVRRSAGALPVLIDPVQIEQVLFNLVVNARDAMPHGGTLTLSTAFAQRATGGERPSAWAELRVADNGQGMTAATRARIFEPFFTTKEAGRGTGLGLATVHGIVTQSGGTIDVASAPGAGTAFEILLPLAEGGAEASAARPAVSPGGPRVRATVLLVEDEPVLRDLVEQMLDQLEHLVLVASSAEEALRLGLDAHTRFDVLLTDLVLPDVGGRVLAQRLLAARPDLKVLFMSGYADHLPGAEAAPPVAAPILAKPFSLADLDSRLQEVLR